MTDQSNNAVEVNLVVGVGANGCACHFVAGEAEACIARLGEVRGAAQDVVGGAVAVVIGVSAAGVSVAVGSVECAVEDTARDVDVDAAIAGICGIRGAL